MDKILIKKFLKLIGFFISLSKIFFFCTYISSSIALFIPFNIADYNQYTFNSTVYIVKSNLNETNIDLNICTGNISVSTFYLINLISQDGWYRNGIYFQYCLCQVLLLAMNSLENYLNFRNIKLTDNYFFKVIINLFQIIFAPSCYIFTVIDFSCIRYKSSQNLIYLAFSANAFLATGSIMLVMAIYLKSNIKKNKIQAIQIKTSDSISNKLSIKEETDKEEAKRKDEPNENELINKNKVNLNSFELIKTQRTITDLIINISPITEISEENEGRVTQDTKIIQKPVNIIEINQESKENSGMIKDRNLNGIIKTFDRSIQMIQKPEKIVDLLLVKMPAIEILDKAEVMNNHEKFKILEEDEENNETKHEPTKASHLINIAREVFEKSSEMKIQLDEIINKNKNLSEMINTIDKSIQMIQKPEKIADLIVDKSLKISSNDILVKTKGILNGKITLDRSSAITKTNEVFDAELSQKQITNDHDLKTTENCDDKNEDPIKSCKILIIILIKLISMIILMGYFSFSLYLFGYMTIQVNGILTGLQNFAMILNIAFSFLIDFIITKKS
jgi:hypothetical protein